MEKKPKGGSEAPAPSTAFKILLLSRTFESAARTLPSCICQGEANRGGTLEKAVLLASFPPACLFYLEKLGSGAACMCGSS